MTYDSLPKGRLSAAGHEYLVTSVTHRRIPVFTDFGRARTLISVFRETGDARLAEWLAWVVMPDHFHALLRLGAEADLGRLLQIVKGRSARRINAMTVGARRLWQPGFHDHALRAEEDRVAIARYVVSNPLRAGLVSRIGDYPHWDCVWL